MEEYQDRSLGGRVFKRLREDILKGRYKQQDELREATIGKELGVSRTPVREALRQLELEGLVTIVPNKGAYVTGISQKDIWDIYQMRKYLEGMCARWAAEHITEDQLEELEETILLSEFQMKKENGYNKEQVTGLDGRFHTILYEASGSRMLCHVLTDFHRYVQMARKSSINVKARAEKSIEEHKAILQAIRDRNPELAEQLAKLKKDVTIITNSAYIAIRIRELPIRKVILLGGEYQKEYQGMVGPLVRKCAKEFYVDKFFVGTDGFIPDAGFTCDDLMRVETMKYMEDSANRMIILADSSKFSQKGVVIQTTFSEIDTVCTDAEIPEDALENLKRHNINVEIVE